MSAASRQRLLAIALFILIAASSIAPIRSYDFFWHLATGRWIADYHALPAYDPFAVASDRSPWVNDEWLFDVVLHGIHSVVGFDGLSLLRALFVALLFAGVFALAARDGDPFAALLFTSLAVFAVGGQFDVRPASAAVALLVIAVASVDAPILFIIVTILWINIHPSAILAPLIPITRMRWRLALGSAAALLVNPWGWRGIAAPIEVAAFVRSGLFVNAEWLPSDVRQFPLLYVTLAMAIALFSVTPARRSHAWRFALLLILGSLAIQHVRNQGLYFAAMPLLVTPYVTRPLSRNARAAIALLALVLLGLVVMGRDSRRGIDGSRFPVRAAARMKAAGLHGNVYDPDQFGGFLIWSLYPERRVLTDGRNELYHTYIGEYSRARLDERAWRALLRKYAVDLAVDEYRQERMEVRNAVTGQHSFVPASLVYWPRQDWALVAYDHAAMVFARRAAFPGEVIEKWEIRDVLPDG
jgi:hypothetical protein